jgi:predicted nucleic acid-binding protein
VRRCLLDTAVFVYALGRDHPYREPCRWIVDALGDERIAGEASVSMVQEFAHVRRRRGGDVGRASKEARVVSGLCLLHAFEEPDLTLMLELLAAYERLDGQDAVFAATALNRAIDVIVSPDPAFDDVPGLERIDPLDTARIEELALA